MQNKVRKMLRASYFAQRAVSKPLCSIEVYSRATDTLRFLPKGCIRSSTETQVMILTNAIRAKASKRLLVIFDNDCRRNSVGLHTKEQKNELVNMSN